MDMFEAATRKKYRFQTPTGLLTTEDLWSLPLTGPANKANLDDIAKALHKQLKNDPDVSFVDKAKKSDPTTQAQFDLVRYIIDTKLREADARVADRAKSEELQTLQAALAEKRAEGIKNLSEDELRQKIAQLQG